MVKLNSRSGAVVGEESKLLCRNWGELFSSSTFSVKGKMTFLCWDLMCEISLVHECVRVPVNAKPWHQQQRCCLGWGQGQPEFSWLFSLLKSCLSCDDQMFKSSDGALKSVLWWYVSEAVGFGPWLICGGGGGSSTEAGSRHWCWHLKSQTPLSGETWALHVEERLEVHKEEWRNKTCGHKKEELMRQVSHYPLKLGGGGPLPQFLLPLLRETVAADSRFSWTEVNCQGKSVFNMAVSCRSRKQPHKACLCGVMLLCSSTSISALRACCSTFSDTSTPNILYAKTLCTFPSFISTAASRKSVCNMNPSLFWFGERIHL